ncbi:putative deoxyuridine 5'-triphosphate nucleotidohydrolase [Trichoderma lentiforme]|uniref:Deoxyuridine 5'-triphosphate nucleotidohydrolase n=1 Tax=Trichoderma lentiforme TaxID=1567552 RepID=A0A9P5CJ13_9HYPO|nr:putative deoxyuridine 5'-triphosphate nucleotidohydrolase [Trichoderma lentiforme]
MLMSGASIVKQGIVRNLRSATQQLQPCGVDLSLRRVLAWTSPATIDFDNSHRQVANISELRFNKDTETIKLRQGAYLVEFNETVSVPLNYMGQVFVRSSLWRSGGHTYGGRCGRRLRRRSWCIARYKESSWHRSSQRCQARADRDASVGRQGCKAKSKEKS